MIAYIKGTIEYRTEQYAVLNNQGIGYIINASPTTLSRLPLPDSGKTTQLHTHMQVKEDDISLYGFTTQDELQLFKLLISISGIGPKVGMAILSVMSPDQVMAAIASDDGVAFSKVPGVGKKTAQRITLELSDKIKSQSVGSSLTGSSNAGITASSAEKQDAMDALVSLGYSQSESMKAVLAVAQEDMTTEQIIKLALKKLI